MMTKDNTEKVSHYYEIWLFLRKVQLLDYPYSHEASRYNLKVRTYE